MIKWINKFSGILILLSQLIFMQFVFSPIEVSAAIKQYKIDFGRSDSPYQSTASGWNNVNDMRTGGAVSNIVDTSNVASTIDIGITNGFIYHTSPDSSLNYWVNANGTSSSALYPSAATRDSFFLGTIGATSDFTAEMVFSGLDDNNIYDFRFYASRVAGDTANRTAVYTIGATSVELNATNNVDGYIEITGVTPTGGQIEIDFARGSGATYAYLGVMEITETIDDPNVNPTANAGSDQAITLPTDTATLSGSGSDTDGTISTYAWSFISGPSTPSITSASSASTGVTALSSVGTYIFRLTVTDNEGGTDTDDMEIIVHDEANQSPTADAGSDQGIQLPITEATLSGSGSDTDGTISTYAWSFVSGPSTPTITSASSASTGVTALSSVGTYIFRLTVTDNGGATDTDDVNIVVEAANVLPTANAGSDVVVSLPTTSTTLSGSGSDTDGTISTYAWTQVSGGAATIVSPTSASTNITDLEEGSYVFRLTVTDNDGGTGTDDVNVTVQTVNVTPTADAGSDQAITLPTNTITLAGSATDTDGTIVSYTWSEVSTGQARIITTTTASTDVTDLANGTYTFRLTATDNDGGTDTDDVIVTVSSHSVSTCPAKTVVTLGSSTTAGYGASPSSNAWVNRFATYFDTLNASNTVVNLGVGGYTTYHILPTGSSTPSRPAPDTTKNITAALTYSPDAIIVNMPSNDTGNGYTISEQQANFQALASVAAANDVPIWIATTQPRNFSQAGIDKQVEMKDWILLTYDDYAIDFWTSLAATDGTINDDYDSGDGVHVNNDGHQKLYNRVLGSTLISEICQNTSPVADAGSDQSIQLPTTQVSLDGAGTDADGTISTYAWSFISGPSTPTIVSANTAETDISGLDSSGTYIFRLTVTDDRSDTDTDDVSIVVEAENVAPVANAGSDQSIQVPTSTVTLGGSATDSDGTISAYVWSFISGPFAPTIDSANTAETDVNDLNIAGTYVFRLTATDNEGATDTDDVNIVVEAANNSPTASAGSDQSIQLPTALATLSGSGDDDDGTISTYAWSFVSGPSTPSITSASSASTGVTALSSAGTYVFRLTVTDNEGATDTDDVSIVVSAANTSPVADAGSDQSIQLPTTQASLDGAATDADGTISTYAWSFVSGPSTPTIESSSSSDTDVSDLDTAGTYVFRLTVTDNQGAIDTDDVEVVVSESDNLNPVADAGSNQTIQLPTSTATLNGSATDTDGSISTYAWSFISGPSTPTVDSANTAETDISGLNEGGTYIFRLTVTDNEGATDTDEISITVQEAASSGGGGGGSSSGGSSNPSTPTEPNVPTVITPQSPTNPFTPELSTLVPIIKVNTLALKVRSTPGGEQVGTVFEGNEGVELSTTTDANGVKWSKTLFDNGVLGYVASSYTESKNLTQTTINTPTARTVEVTASLLNVRTAPGGAFKKMVPRGQKATLVSDNGTWLYVTFADGTDGWISKSYTKMVSAVVQDPTFSPGLTYDTKPNIQTIAVNLNVRATPGGAIINKVPVGSKGFANYNSLTNSWVQVNFDSGVTGYASTLYLQAI